ncbi:MAG: ATP synthase F1 subunit gamma [Elusimicrobia bacterium RIFOXYB2_FULL_49_7]|nr:MAG: ATP synthase F1 subunit gamma [Elusimicrobia bacterium RIFOXYB2_FULL_49_7]
MAGTKEVNKKILSLKNTQKITKAMKMIAATKLRKAQFLYEQSEPFAKGFSEIMYRIAGSYSLDHPLFEGRPLRKNVHLVLFTSDRGLCGGFNNNVIKAAHTFLAKCNEENVKVTMSFFGKRGYEHFRKRKVDIGRFYEGVINKPGFERMAEAAETLVSQFLKGDNDGVHIIFNEYQSAIRQIPVTVRLLPMAPETYDKDKKRLDFLFEPSPEDILNDLVVRGVKLSLFRSLLNSIVAEQAARMNAMDSASNNCRELVDKLTLQRNKARQAAITRELVEIVSGAESL